MDADSLTRKTSDTEQCQQLSRKLDEAVARLAQTSDFAKGTRSGEVMALVHRLFRLPCGIDMLYERVAELEEAGIFAGSDWAHPEILQPGLAMHTLRTGDEEIVVVECLSEIRLLAIAREDYFHPAITSEHARHFLAQVLALNLDFLFEHGSEAERARRPDTTSMVRELYHYLIDHIGYENILDQLIEEVWRILAQRPIQLDSVKEMVTRMAVCLNAPDIDMGSAGRGADRLVSALYGPTNGTREDPGLALYAERLESMDESALQQEASGFSRAMHDTGLVSPYHPLFLRHICCGQRDDLLTTALGLSGTGRDALLCYQQLVHTLIREAIFPETSQSVYGLALFLERGSLYQPPVAPALWRQIALPLSKINKAALTRVFGNAQAPRVFLLAGVLNMLGQPLGIGQGNNPTCQAARALSMWSYNDPDYLLQMIAWAARDDEIVMHFEGQRISSMALADDNAAAPIDVDPVSVILVPHLDRIYTKMGGLCETREEDPHCWINPEFHGWWVGRGFRIAVYVSTGELREYEDFIRHFYAVYHPFYNGNQPLIHPQPAGIAATDSAARFVGWHAITILRVALDQEGEVRVYFFNPNNDSGQDWGENVIVSTEGYGERYGESSLPVGEFASRLYLFHFDPLERGFADRVPEEDIRNVIAQARLSWAAER
ncbi:MAG TPA: hypothetical protein VJ961_03525 [Mariprofundaceae bacterium]|nr:hypothetical protein [Mariprofundaceae bacterium]